MIDQLVQQGVTHFYIAPGARSSPLAIAAARNAKAKTVVHFDERGVGFLALGFGKGAKSPAALIVTSGSALGNLMPAVMEAHHSATPLILLTADRPAELRACGANQTTEQLSPFASLLRFQLDLPPAPSESYLRSVAAQAFFYATQNPPGPVQLNCQIRDPFSASFPPSQGPPLFFPPSAISSPKMQTSAAKGAIAIGRIPSSPLPILELAKRLKWPIFADLLSNARNYPTEEQIRHFDLIIKTRPDLKPDFLLHFGERLTSKEIEKWPATLHMSPYPFLQDPTRELAARARSDIAPFCAQFEAKSDPSWLPSWQKASQAIDKTLWPQFQDPPFTEAHALFELAQKMPPDAALFLGNSMPIRLAERYFYPKACRGYFCNRGLSGIDGNIATAVGIAEGHKTRLIAFIGDQAALHDLNSLPLLKKSSNPVTLIISNNFGGGIFSHLPLSQFPECKEYIEADHSWHFQEAAKMFDLPYLTLDEALSCNRSAIVEIQTSREANFRFHNNLNVSYMQKSIDKSINRLK